MGIVLAGLIMVLFFISLGGLVVGLINPTKVMNTKPLRDKKKTRLNVIKYSLMRLIVLFFALIIVALATDDEELNSTLPEETVEEQVVEEEEEEEEELVEEVEEEVKEEQVEEKEAEKKTKPKTREQLIAEFNESKLTYDDLMRNPDKHGVQPVSFTGKVGQVIGEENDSVVVLLDVNGTIAQRMVITIPDSELEGRLLEGDNIRIYGYFMDIQSYTTVLGANKEVPHIMALYVDTK